MHAGHIPQQQFARLLGKHFHAEVVVGAQSATALLHCELAAQELLLGLGQGLQAVGQHCLGLGVEVRLDFWQQMGLERAVQERFCAQFRVIFDRDEVLRDFLATHLLLVHLTHFVDLASQVLAAGVCVEAQPHQVRVQLHGLDQGLGALVLDPV